MRSSGRALIQSDQCPPMKRNWNSDIHRGKSQANDRGLGRLLLSLPSEGTIPAWTLDLQPPELGDNTLLWLKPPAVLCGHGGPGRLTQSPMPGDLPRPRLGSPTSCAWCERWGRLRPVWPGRVGVLR